MDRLSSLEDAVARTSGDPGFASLPEPCVQAPSMIFDAGRTKESNVTREPGPYGLGVDIRHLRYFIATAEEGNFGRAADRLGVAQPALSRQIAQLEALMKSVLFDRTRRQIKLTHAGEVLLPRARDIITRVIEATAAARHAQEGATGILEVGLIPSANYSVAPSIIQRFIGWHPHVNVALYSMGSTQLHTRVVEGQIQAAFSRPASADDALISETIAHETLVLAIPENDPLASESFVSLSALETRPLILSSRPRPSRAVLEMCRAVGVNPKIIQEAPDIISTLGLVTAGMGAAMVPSSVARVGWPGVVYRPLEHSPPTVELSLVYRRDNRSPVLREFVNTVRAVLAEKKWPQVNVVRPVDGMNMANLAENEVEPIMPASNSS